MTIFIPGAGHTLLGRNQFQVMQLSWKHIYQPKVVNTTYGVKDTLAKYPNVFKNKLDTLKGFIAKLSVHLEMKAIFRKACYVLYVLCEKLDKNFTNLSLFIEPVQYSEWTDFIVYQSICLYTNHQTKEQDTSQSLNSLLSFCNFHTKLRQGQKLNLRSEFLQMPLDKDSKQYLNIPHGLNRFYHFRFLTLDICQHCMENL